MAEHTPKWTKWTTNHRPRTCLHTLTRCLSVHLREGRLDRLETVPSSNRFPTVWRATRISLRWLMARPWSKGRARKSKSTHQRQKDQSWEIRPHIASLWRSKPRRPTEEVINNWLRSLDTRTSTMASRSLTRRNPWTVACSRGPDQSLIKSIRIPK